MTTRRPQQIDDSEISHRSQELFSAIEGSQTAMMLVNRDLEITYFNPASRVLFETHASTFKQAFPGFDAQNLMGVCIDRFHKDPAMQRRLLSDPRNLPHRADIQVGPLTFALNVSAIHDREGNYVGNALEWADVTDARKSANEAATIRSAIEGSQTAMMMVDRNLIITYFNPASRRLFDTHLVAFRQAFPGFDPERVLGACIDQFHKDPSMQRKLLSDPRNLPYTAEIQVLHLDFRLNVSAMLDSQGRYIGSALEWSDITEELRNRRHLKDTMSMVESGTTDLNEATKSLQQITGQLNSEIERVTHESQLVATAANQVSTNMLTVSSAAEQASANINSISVSTEEMTHSISDIANNAEKARRVTGDAVKNVENAQGRVDELGQAAKEISKVIEAIVEIAEQTKLLALNATIEAARAGEAGKGFAVVANEVKELAAQTREATADIRQKIENMQNSTESTVREISNINAVINGVNEIVNMIATAVEEQNVTTRDIATNIAQATLGVRGVNESINQAADLTRSMANNLEGINQGIAGIHDASTLVGQKTDAVAGTSTQLQSLVDRLKNN